jgi:hypothetical protein
VRLAVATDGSFEAVCETCDVAVALTADFHGAYRVHSGAGRATVSGVAVQSVGGVVDASGEVGGGGTGMVRATSLYGSVLLAIF